MPIRALIVDDSQAARLIIRHHLRAAGCTIAGEAANTVDALHLFRKIKPDIVTLDLMMPRLFSVDSMALLRTMKREMPQAAVIVVSVIPFEKTRHDCLEQGALAYVLKPLTDASFEPVRIKLVQNFPALVATRA
jgi:two-component system, chemotaxis family, chemotaxis protein CheY